MNWMCPFLMKINFWSLYKITITLKMEESLLIFTVPLYSLHNGLILSLSWDATIKSSIQDLKRENMQKRKFRKIFNAKYFNKSSSMLINSSEIDLNVSLNSETKNNKRCKDVLIQQFNGWLITSRSLSRVTDWVKWDGTGWYFLYLFMGFNHLSTFGNKIDLIVKWIKIMGKVQKFSIFISINKRNEVEILDNN